jgi:abortive infection bacteriophage resistance protein
MMSKPFKTIDELVDIMESRGICTDVDTRCLLMSESYYAIINGYKAPFLDKKAMEKSAEDIYLDGTTFAEIHSLFSFDRELRHITFAAIIKAEAIMKSATVYAFSEACPSQGAYLDRTNYTNPDDMLVPKGFKGNKAHQYHVNMAGLLSTLSNKLIPDKTSRAFIKHYVNAHGSVPLWVLSNDLTFGNMAHFYQLLPRQVQNRACKIIVSIHEHHNSDIRIQPIELLAAYNVLKDFRNICAHDERLYCARPARSGAVDYSTMARQLRKTLPSEQFQAYWNSVFELFKQYQNKFSIADPLQIFREMGFAAV